MFRYDSCSCYSCRRVSNHDFCPPYCCPNRGRSRSRNRNSNGSFTTSEIESLVSENDCNLISVVSNKLYAKLEVTNPLYYDTCNLKLAISTDSTNIISIVDGALYATSQLSSNSGNLLTTGDDGHPLLTIEHITDAVNFWNYADNASADVLITRTGPVKIGTDDTESDTNTIFVTAGNSNISSKSFTIDSDTTYTSFLSAFSGTITNCDKTSIIASNSSTVGNSSIKTSYNSLISSLESKLGTVGTVTYSTIISSQGGDVESHYSTLINTNSCKMSSSNHSGQFASNACEMNNDIDYSAIISSSETILSENIANSSVFSSNNSIINNQVSYSTISSSNGSTVGNASFSSINCSESCTINGTSSYSNISCANDATVAHSHCNILGGNKTISTTHNTQLIWSSGDGATILIYPSSDYIGFESSYIQMNNLVTTPVSFAWTSDSSLKNDLGEFVSYDDVYDKLDNLELHNFNWKINTNKNFMGLFAQNFNTTYSTYVNPTLIGMINTIDVPSVFGIIFATLKSMKTKIDSLL